MKTVFPAPHTQPRPLRKTSRCVREQQQSVGGVADDPQGLFVNLFVKAR